MSQTMAPVVIYLSTTPSQVSTIGVDAEIVNGNDLKIEVNGAISQVTLPNNIDGKVIQFSDLASFIQDPLNNFKIVYFDALVDGTYGHVFYAMGFVYNNTVVCIGNSVGLSHIVYHITTSGAAVIGLIINTAPPEHVAFTSCNTIIVR